MTITNSYILSKTAANLKITFANMAKSAVLYAMAGCCILALSNNIVARSINRFGRLGHRANGGCFNPTREFLADGSTEHWVIHLSVFPQRTCRLQTTYHLTGFLHPPLPLMCHQSEHLTYMFFEYRLLISLSSS